jgi:hypothetical protein
MLKRINLNKLTLFLAKKAPSYGFGSGQRESKRYDSPLGPGSYEAKTSFDKALVKREFKQTAQRGVNEN